ncbi:unnamed protein product, partial [Closterium sp. NIES-54]
MLGWSSSRLKHALDPICNPTYPPRTVSTCNASPLPINPALWTVIIPPTLPDRLCFSGVTWCTGSSRPDCSPTFATPLTVVDSFLHSRAVASPPANHRSPHLSASPPPRIPPPPLRHGGARGAPAGAGAAARRAAAAVAGARQQRRRAAAIRRASRRRGGGGGGDGAAGVLRAAAALRRAAAPPRALAAAPAFHASHAPLLPLLHFPSCHVAASRAGGAGGRAGEERAKEEVYQQWARARYGEYTGALKARLRSSEGSAASKVRGGAGGRGESCWWGRAWGADRRVEGRGRRGRIAGGMLGEREGEGEWGVGRGRCRQEQGGWRMAEGGEEEGRGDGWATVVRGTNARAMHFTGCEHPHYPSSSPLRAPPPLPHQRIAVEHLMELARLEKKGGLAGATINKILIPLVEGEAGDPSVLAKLASFFTHADVRRHVYGAVEQLCASMAAAATKHTSAAEDADGHAAVAKRDAMCLNILEVLLAMPMLPAPKPGGKRLVAEVGQGGGEQDDLLSTWALPAPPS